MNVQPEESSSNFAIHSAAQMAEVERKMDAIKRETAAQQARRDLALSEAAEAGKAQLELLQTQVIYLKEQNSLLQENYNKLNELYRMQQQSAQKAKEDLKISRRFNICMLVVSVVSMLAAVIVPVVMQFS